MPVLTKAHSEAALEMEPECPPHSYFVSFCLQLISWPTDLSILNMRTSFSVYYKNFVTYVDFMLLRKRKNSDPLPCISYKCVRSVHQFECCVKETTRAFQQLSNDHL